MPNLQSADRNHFGECTDANLADTETKQADVLRKSLSSLYRVPANQRVTIAQLRADMPPHLQFKTYQDRVAHMLQPGSSVGQHEIHHIGLRYKWHIQIFQDNLCIPLAVGDPNAEKCLHVLYKEVGDAIGHYEALVPC